MNQELWNEAQARAIARRAIALAMAAPMSESDRRATLLDAVLEFAPDVFALLQQTVPASGHVVLSEGAVARALVEADALRDALATQRAGNVALYSVFAAAAELCDVWDAAASHADAKAKLQTAVEAYRELVAPLGEHGGTDPGKSPVQP